MPRPRVKDEDRKRVARACDTCKRRKEKCDGQHPCLLCKRRGREPECVFTEGHSKRGSSLSHSSSHRPGRGSNPSSAHPITLQDALTDSNDAEIAIESLLTLSGSRSGAPNKSPQYFRDADDDDEDDDDDDNDDDDDDQDNGDQGLVSKAPVPKLARLLRDGRGKFIFVGDSSNLAFVQNIRRLVKSEIGECQLTSDPLRHAMCEVIPPHKVPSPLQSQHPKPGPSEAQDLVRHYLLASSGVIDLFEPDEITEQLCAWTTRDPAAETDVGSSIYYLVMAVGALTRDAGDLDQAEFYFMRGREIGVSSFLEDPSVLTIQAYALIAFYMLSATRRNGAFMLLGIAVRAAYALGLHRSDISKLFEPRERLARERVWKSLRVLDLYMSGSLGRPPATSEVDGGSVSWNRSTRDYEGIQMNGRNTSATLRICFIFERILNEVYCRREVSVQLVESISRQYRDWTVQLPAGLQADSLDQKAGTTSPSLRQTIGIAHLKGAYYWSIILLTRPFLIFKVSSKIKGRSEDDDGAGHSVTMTLSEACIDAALRSIEIATDLVHTPGIPRRLFMITNSVFISAMVIGFAIFGDFDKSFPLLSSIAQAASILNIMAKDDMSARRHDEITRYLRLAAIEHISRRDRLQMQRRRQDIHNIFGDPINKSNGARSTRSATGNHTPTDVAASGSPPNNELAEVLGMADAMAEPAPPWQLRFDMPPESRGPVLTTSGALASNGEGPEPPTAQPRPDFGQMPDTDYLSPDGSGIPSLPSYAEEFPLFSLMTEYDQMQDPFSMVGP
jgi:hypothetical protein